MIDASSWQTNATARTRAGIRAGKHATLAVRPIGLAESTICAAAIVRDHVIVDGLIALFGLGGVTVSTAHLLRKFDRACAEAPCHGVDGRAIARRAICAGAAKPQWPSKTGAWTCHEGFDRWIMVAARRARHAEG